MCLRHAAPAVLLALAACGSVDQVDVTRSATVSVPGGPGGTALAVDAIAVDLQIDRRALDQEGIDGNDIDSARLRSVRVEVQVGTSLEKWLDSLELHIEAPGLPRTLLARKDGIRVLPAGTPGVDLDVPDVDLKPYLLAERSTITTGASGNQPDTDTTVKVSATIRVDVSVSGLLN
jgi:hypothetical protein